ncbi:MAG: hypothetical protein GY754_20425 [bacterium]|nr:hypothetical protein [bacterium]
MKIKTEFSFVLPADEFDKEGKAQKMRGKMRLIKVSDLLDIYRDVRVKESEAYFYVVLLAKVVINLGPHRMIHTRIIENLSTENFAFLVDFLNEINHKVLSTFPVKCSNCGNIYIGDVSMVGEQ